MVFDGGGRDLEGDLLFMRKTAIFLKRNFILRGATGLNINFYPRISKLKYLVRQERHDSAQGVQWHLYVAQTPNGKSRTARR